MHEVQPKTVAYRSDTLAQALDAVFVASTVWHAVRIVMHPNAIYHHLTQFCVTQQLMQPERHWAQLAVTHSTRTLETKSVV